MHTTSSRLLIACFFLLIFGAANTAFSQKRTDDILGKWLTENGKSKVEVYKQGNEYFAKIYWLKDPLREDGSVKLDRENPDDKLKSQPILGLVILKNLVFDGDDEWEDGTVYDPESGNTYSCYLEFEGDKLKLRGYVGFSLLGRTSYWTRISE